MPKTSHLTPTLAHWRDVVRDSVNAASKQYVRGNPEEALYELASARRAVEAAIAQTVREVRDPDEFDPPLAWEQIGRALGVSKQAVQQRYGATEDP